MIKCCGLVMTVVSSSRLKRKLMVCITPWRKEMTRLVCNMIRCNHCMSVLISHHAHDYKECSCGKVFIDGGTDYLRRGYSEVEDYTEMSLYSDSPFELLRHFIFRGSRGKDGKSPLEWIKLSVMDDKYLDNLIRYKEDGGQKDMWYDYYVQEKKFREESHLNR